MRGSEDEVGGRALGEDLTSEEGGRNDVPDEHECDAEQERPDADDEDATDSTDGRAPIRGLGVLHRRDDECPEKHEPAEEGEQAFHEEVAAATEDVAPVEPHRSEAGQSVVEGDHESDSRDRVAKDVLAHEGQPHVEDDRDRSHPNGGDGRSHVSRMDAGE